MNSSNSASLFISILSCPDERLHMLGEELGPLLLQFPWFNKYHI